MRAAKAYYGALEKESNVKYVQISDLYANRGSNTLFRLYVDVAYYDEKEEINRYTLPEKTKGKGR